MPAHSPTHPPAHSPIQPPTHPQTHFPSRLPAQPPTHPHHPPLDPAPLSCGEHRAHELGIAGLWVGAWVGVRELLQRLGEPGVLRVLRVTQQARQVLVPALPLSSDLGAKQPGDSMSLMMTGRLFPNPGGWGGDWRHGGSNPFLREGSGLDPVASLETASLEALWDLQPPGGRKCLPSLPATAPRRRKLYQKID